MTLPLKKEVAASYHRAIMIRRISQGPGVDIDKLTGKKNSILLVERTSIYLVTYSISLQGRKKGTFYL